MADWIQQTDRFLAFNERAILTGPGKVTHQQMEAIIAAHYADFNSGRRAAARATAEDDDRQDLRQLEAEARRLAALADPDQRRD